MLTLGHTHLLHVTQYVHSSGEGLFTRFTEQVEDKISSHVVICFLIPE